MAVEKKGAKIQRNVVPRISNAIGNFSRSHAAPLVLASFLLVMPAVTSVAQNYGGAKKPGTAQYEDGKLRLALPKRKLARAEIENAVGIAWEAIAAKYPGAARAWILKKQMHLLPGGLDALIVNRAQFDSLEMAQFGACKVGLNGTIHINGDSEELRGEDIVLATSYAMAKDFAFKEATPFGGEADYFAHYIMAKSVIEFKPDIDIVPGRETATMFFIISRTGEIAFVDAYFLGKTDVLREAVDSQFGEGTYGLLCKSPKNSISLLHSIGLQSGKGTEIIDRGIDSVSATLNMKIDPSAVGQ